MLKTFATICLIAVQVGAWTWTDLLEGADSQEAGDLARQEEAAESLEAAEADLAAGQSPDATARSVAAHRIASCNLAF